MLQSKKNPQVYLSNNVERILINVALLVLKIANYSTRNRALTIGFNSNKIRPHSTAESGTAFEWRDRVCNEQAHASAHARMRDVCVSNTKTLQCNVQYVQLNTVQPSYSTLIKIVIVTTKKITMQYVLKGEKKIVSKGWTQELYIFGYKRNLHKHFEIPREKIGVIDLLFFINFKSF